MKRDGDRPGRNASDPDRRKTPRSRQGGYVSRGNADDGRSGHGSESVRPYLRAQLKLRELMAGAQLGNDAGRPGKQGK